MPKMFIFLFPLLFLLIDASTDCSQPNACYGLPANCQPDTNCHVFFRFDAQGNLDVHLNDVIDPMDYVAMTVKDLPSPLLSEYLICIPHQRQRIRGYAYRGDPIHITEHMAPYVRQRSATSFVCAFLANELPDDFQNSDVFSVSEGIYSDDLVIPTSKFLFKSEQVFSHPIAARFRDSENSDFLSPDEKKKTSDLLQKMRRISGDDDDEEENDDVEDSDDLEGLMDKKYSTRRREEENKKKKEVRRRPKKEEEEEENSEDVEDSESPRKKKKPTSRRGRPSRYEKDEEEEEEEFDPMEEGDVPKRRRPTSRRGNSEDNDEKEEEKPKKKTTKKENRKKKDSDEDDDDYYDKKDNGDDDKDNGSISLHHTTATLCSSLIALWIIAH
ncbi:Protein CBG13743 [Caenorhabditis briggsae]|uniref:Protein CBG13743 n=2 Tax=Caenorhabditis briggsae TaxID=6238 RepID=A8XIL2_CAEBR|nr:Protein CBG13743 [Caenorhabditis briggsae]ULT93262.1 hypothetical protein L3Y34_003031 [Caenorhabditis briggsae]CAP32487.2 Protein CBG13743 [Caenorhabditis briggsae]